MTTELASFFHYNHWANMRLLDACAQLSDPQLDARPLASLESIRTLVLHTLASEEGCDHLSRFP